MALYTNVTRFPSFLTGQRLFQRLGASDSFSETSSIEQAEEMSREGCTGHSSSIQYPASPPAPEEDLNLASNVIPEQVQESPTEVPSQAEAEVASESRQPEGQEAEHSER